MVNPVELHAVSPLTAMANIPLLANAVFERKLSHDLPPFIDKASPLLEPIQIDELSVEIWDTELLGGRDEVSPCNDLSTGESTILGLEG